MIAAARTPDLSLAALARPFVLVAVFAFFAGFAAFVAISLGEGLYEVDLAEPAAAAAPLAASAPAAPQAVFSPAFEKHI